MPAHQLIQLALVVAQGPFGHPNGTNQARRPIDDRLAAHRRTRMTSSQVEAALSKIRLHTSSSLVHQKTPAQLFGCTRIGDRIDIRKQQPPRLRSGIHIAYLIWSSSSSSLCLLCSTRYHSRGHPHPQRNVLGRAQNPPGNTLPPCDTHSIRSSLSPLVLVLHAAPSRSSRVSTSYRRRMASLRPSCLPNRMRLVRMKQQRQRTLCWKRSS